MVTGFLGSGKTTLAVKLAQTAVNQGRQVAILVNEIGEIGIDGQLMQQLDLNIWEMYDGCICCTLAADLVPALEEIDQSYNVDLVLMEPTGVAEPRNILKILPYYKGNRLESITSVSILDPLRIIELYEVMTPLITNQLANAQYLLINKADVATKEQLAGARRIAAEVNPEARLMIMSAQKPGSPDVLKELLPWN
ncbi:MAG: cobalamin biosynthesis protein P47K [Dehalococcoidia bacterium]|nr:cobalamin biosynthesis protein P47K [Dehalococcoidia bacterium]